MVEQLIRLIVHSRSLLRPPRSSKFLDRSIFCLDHSYAEGQLIRISLFDSHAVKIHNQLETMRGDPRVVVATSVDPKMVGCKKPNWSYMASCIMFAKTFNPYSSYRSSVFECHFRHTHILWQGNNCRECFSIGNFLRIVCFIHSLILWDCKCISISLTTVYLITKVGRTRH